MYNNRLKYSNKMHKFLHSKSKEVKYKVNENRC